MNYAYKAPGFTFTNKGYGAFENFESSYEITQEGGGICSSPWKGERLDAINSLHAQRDHLPKYQANTGQPFSTVVLPSRPLMETWPTSQIYIDELWRTGTFPTHVFHFDYYWTPGGVWVVAIHLGPRKTASSSGKACNSSTIDRGLQSVRPDQSYEATIQGKG